MRKSVSERAGEIGPCATSAAAPIPRNLLDGYEQIGNSSFEMQSYAAFGEVNYAIHRPFHGDVWPAVYAGRQGRYASARRRAGISDWRYAFTGA